MRHVAPGALVCRWPLPQSSSCWSRRFAGPGRNRSEALRPRTARCYSLSGSTREALRQGDSIDANETLRSNGGAGAMLALTDGSRVEMRSQSELSLERADDGVRIRLGTGGIIVNAAKQDQGRLYVQTKDMTVAVVGTVFVVNAEEGGSRVAVIEGEVRVHEGRTETTLRPGEQVSTNRAVSARPAAEEIAWSRRADTYRAILANFDRGMALSAGPRTPLTKTPVAAAQGQPVARASPQHGSNSKRRRSGRAIRTTFPRLRRLARRRGEQLSDDTGTHPRVVPDAGDDHPPRLRLWPVGWSSSIRAAAAAACVQQHLRAWRGGRPPREGRPGLGTFRALHDRRRGRRRRPMRRRCRGRCCGICSSGAFS